MFHSIFLFCDIPIEFEPWDSSTGFALFAFLKFSFLVRYGAPILIIN